MKGKRFKAEIRKDQRNLDLSMDDREEIIDNFNGIQFWWVSNSVLKKNTTISFYPSSEEKRYFSTSIKLFMYSSFIYIYINVI